MSINISMEMTGMTTNVLSEEEIAGIIEEHRIWLENEFRGKRADFSYTDLEGYDFHGKDLSKADFTGANIIGTDFSGTILKEAVMNNVIGVNVNLSGADLSQAELRNAHITHSNLEQINLTHADITGSTMWDNNMKNAELKAACFVRSKLCDSVLTGANAEQAIFLLTDVDYVSFKNANCRYALFMYLINGHWADFENADLTEADFYASGIYSEDLEKSVGGFLLPVCPEEGSFIAWGLCRGGKIVKFLIPEDASRRTVCERVSAAGAVKVLSVFDLDGNEMTEGTDFYNEDRIYKKGELIEDKDGIYFYISRMEAEDLVKRALEREKDREEKGENDN